MHSKLKLKENGWYKTEEGVIYKLVPCEYANGRICGALCGLGLKAVRMNKKNKRTMHELCLMGDIKRRLKFYCTDEEIMVNSL